MSNLSRSECILCKHKANKGFINTTCLNCKRQYIGQEAEDYKTDKFEPINNKCLECKNRIGKICLDCKYGNNFENEEKLFDRFKEYLLEPCPFCNYQRKDEKKIGQIIIREKEYDIAREKGDNAVKSWYHITCLKCKCKTNDYDTEEKAINAWNMRGGKSE